MKIEAGRFFKTWTDGNVRIMKDAADKGFYPYAVQKFNGKTWDKVDACTLCPRQRLS